MPRRTPTVTLSNTDIKRLNSIVRNSKEGSPGYKRAAVLLDCGKGIQGKEIAVKYGVTANMVTDWRRKYERGGVDGLMSDARRPGRRGAGHEPLKTRIENALRENPPSGTDSWSSSALASVLGEKLPTVQHCLSEMGISLTHKRQWELMLPPGLEHMGADVAGVYLACDVQLLALALSPSGAAPVLDTGKMVTISGNTARTLEKAEIENGGISLAQALRMMAALEERGVKGRRLTSPHDFIHSLHQLLSAAGLELYIVACAANAAELMSGLSGRLSVQESRADWLKSSHMWFKALDWGGSVADELDSALKAWLDTAGPDDEPFIWRVESAESGAGAEGSADGDQKMGHGIKIPEGGNLLIVTFEYNDSQGRRLVCSREFANAVPNLDAYSGSADTQEYIRLVGELEQGAIKGAQDVTQSFISSTLGNGSSMAKSGKKNTPNQPAIPAS